FRVVYGSNSDAVEMYGDTVISADWGTIIDGLEMDEFHTYRYETPDGENYTISVDGLVFMDRFDDDPNSTHLLRLQPRGACGVDPAPDIKNEWDYVRFG
ncbi:MAG: hypothetical protein JSU63_09070, partial [Phycisphaerales bacterium]